MYYQIDVSLDYFKKLKFFFNKNFQKNFKHEIKNFPAIFEGSSLSYKNTLNKNIKMKKINNIVNFNLTNTEIDIKGCFEKFLQTNFLKVFIKYEIISDKIIFNISNNKLQINWIFYFSNKDDDCLEIIKYIEYFINTIHN